MTAGSYRSVTVNANGVVTQGSNPTTLAGYAIGDAYTKADTDGKLAQKANKATTLAGYGITDALRVDGNAVSSSRLAAPRSLAASGDASWSVTFDGSANVSAPLSLSATGVAAGSYPKVTVDTKGRVTAGMALAATDIPGLDASKLVSGVLAEQRLPVFARGLATAVSNSSDPNTATVPLMLTNHANGPVAGRYFYIQSMFYPDQNGNASQIATSYNATSEMYVRVSYAANPSIREWLPWQRCDIGGSFTKEADGELPGGVNLDSMVTSGWWSQSFTAQAASGANYPIVRAGLLHVYAASSNFIYQTYQAYDGESFYFRCRHSNTWFPWRRMWHGGDFNPSDYLLKSGFYWNALPGKPATFPPSAHNHDVGQLTSGILPWHVAASVRIRQREHVALSEQGFLRLLPLGRADGGGTMTLASLGNGGRSLAPPMPMLRLRSRFLSLRYASADMRIRRVLSIRERMPVQVSVERLPLPR